MAGKEKSLKTSVVVETRGHEEVSTPPRKRRKCTQQFKSSYQDEWPCIQRSKRGTHFAYCTVCNFDINISHGGRDDVRRHTKCKRHLDLLKVSQESKSISKFLVTDKEKLDIIRAETYFASFLVEHNLPIAAADHAGKLFKIMFPDSQIADKFSCGRTKTTAIIGVLAKDTQSKLVSSMRQQPFSISTDGSTDKSKMYPVVVKTLSTNTSGETGVSLLSVPVCNENATGQAIFNVLDNEIQKRRLDWKNCVSFGCDNAAVMTGLRKGVIAYIREKHPKVWMAGCPCHLIHLAAEKAAKELDVGVEEILIDIFYYMDKSTKRLSGLKHFQELCGVEPRRIFKHVSTRWLSLGACIDRLLEQWEPVYKFFLEEFKKLEEKSKKQENVSKHKVSSRPSTSSARPTDGKKQIGISTANSHKEKRKSHAERTKPKAEEETKSLTSVKEMQKSHTARTKPKAETVTKSHTCGKEKQKSHTARTKPKAEEETKSHTCGKEKQKSHTARTKPKAEEETKSHTCGKEKQKSHTAATKLSDGVRKSHTCGKEKQKSHTAATKLSDGVRKSHSTSAKPKPCDAGKSQSSQVQMKSSEKRVSSPRASESIVCTANVRVKRVYAALSSNLFKVVCVFLQSVIPVFNKINCALQSEKPMIHKLRHLILELLRLLMIRFIKPAVLATTHVTSVDYSDRNNQKEDGDLMVGSEARSILQNRDLMTEAVEKDFYKRARKYFTKACDYILAKLPLDDELLKHAEVLDVDLKTKVMFSSLEYFLTRFPCLLPSGVTRDDIEEQFCLYQSENLPSSITIMDRVDSQWHSIGQLKDGDGKLKYSSLSQVMRGISVIPHSNADCERVFSLVRKNLTDFRPNLSDQTLENLLILKSTKAVCCDHKFSNDLLKQAKSATYIANNQTK